MEGGKHHNGIENIDHPVIAARDLDVARTTYEKLGFTIPPRGSHIEWGTGNLCIMFPDDYLEIRGIIDASRFTMHLDEHLDTYGEGLMGVAFGTSEVEESFSAAIDNGIAAGEMRSLTRNFEHPEGWTQPSFRLFAPAAADIEGLMHVVIIEHLTPELIRRPDFLEHPNGCVGVHGMAGTIYDIERCAAKMRSLLGSKAVAVRDEGLFLQLPTAQHIELLLPDIYADRYGEIAASPEPRTPRLGALTLRVDSLAKTGALLEQNAVPYAEPHTGMLRVASDHCCGVTLHFTESLRTRN